jgi:molybdopterin-binding protein
MDKQVYTASEAARALGISLDTLRRWDRQGLIETSRDKGNRRQVSAREITRLRGSRGSVGLSARNRLGGVVSSVKIDGLLAQVELQVTEPVTVVAIVTRESIEDLGLKPGIPATAVVKSTSVMVER